MDIKDLFRNSLIALTVLAAAPLVAVETQDDETQDDETGYEVDFESTSHVVRQEEDRLNFRYHTGKWDFEGLLATLTPPFREDRDQIGFSVARAFDWGELLAVARRTDKPVGEDVVTSVRYQRAGAASAFGVEMTFGQADLAIDDFLVEDGESQFVGSLFWRRESGLEVTVFAASSGTFDLMRGTRELLERLPRSELVGAETLADVYVDEERLENSAGVSVGFGRDRWKAHVYVKGGDQTLRGFPEGDDFVGFGGDFRFEVPRWTVDTEVALRQIDTADGFDSFDRGRFFFDVRHRPGPRGGDGRYEWGFGGYVQGEAENFSGIPDVYDTAGLGVTASRRLASGKRVGLWAMWEDNAPELQVITRLAFFHRTDEREYGVGIRRDQVGPKRFEDETFGPFFTFKLPFRNLALNGDVGVQDDSAYGRLSIEFKKR